jgi:hypothetical protein
MASALPIERFERPKGSASMQRPKTSLANRAGSANARNRQIQVIPKEALESVKNNRLPKVVVIGSGAAGLVCVDTLREFGFYAGKLGPFLLELCFSRNENECQFDREFGGFRG